MPAKEWTVLDAKSGTYIDTKPGSPFVMQLAGNDELRVEKETKRGGLADGVDVLTVHNGDFRFALLPTRGMSVWNAEYKQDRIGWQSPVRGPVHPKFVDVGEPGGLGWLDGFDELLVRCGLESNGAPEFDENGRLKFPLHGRISNKPAESVKVTIDDDAITVEGVVFETRFHFLKLQLTTKMTTRRGERSFRIMDEVANLSASPAEVQMLYHINLGAPFLDAGTQFVAPLKVVVPRNARAAEGIGASPGDPRWRSFEAPQAGFEEQVYFMELLSRDDGSTNAMLKTAHGDKGVNLDFNKRQLPCFTIWKNTTAIEDGYVTGIEPATNFPNPRSYEGEQSRFIALRKGGTCKFDLVFEYLADEAAVGTALKAIDDLQSTETPRIYDEPQPGWCAP